MTTLRQALHEIAVSFAVGVFSAVRAASLQELREGVAEADLEKGRPAPVPVTNGRSPKAAAAPLGAAKGPAQKTTRSGRLRRRSPEEIAATLDNVVALVKRHRDGLRAEQIRSELGLEAKEMPRILKEGISTRKLRSKGQKRATTYFAP
jgi:hypothetical protein